jgi:hypothetical protein
MPVYLIFGIKQVALLIIFFDLLRDYKSHKEGSYQSCVESQL